MNAIKKFFICLLLNKYERIVVWDALWYSNHIYRKRGKIEEANDVKEVMDKLKNIFGIKIKKYTEEEVENMINEIANANAMIISKISLEKYNEGFKAGEKNKTINEPDMENVKEVPGIVKEVPEVSEPAPEVSEPIYEHFASEWYAEDDGPNYEEE
jgi:hypothetical protein